MKWQVLEHPADFKLRAWGSTLAELFTNMALGMAAHLVGSRDLPVAKGKKETIEIRSNDSVSLLVDFLSELLSRSDANNTVYTDIDFRKISEDHLVAEIRRAGTVKQVDEIKGVTYHQSAVNKTDAGYEAIILFDT